MNKLSAYERPSNLLNSCPPPFANCYFLSSYIYFTTLFFKKEKKFIFSIDIYFFYNYIGIRVKYVNTKLQVKVLTSGDIILTFTVPHPESFFSFPY